MTAQTTAQSHEQLTTARRGGPADDVRAARRQALLSSGRLLPLVVAALHALVLAAMALIGSESSSVNTITVDLPDRGITAFTFYDSDLATGGAIGSFAGSLPLWLVAVGLVALTGLWTLREKAAIVLLAPTLAVAFAALPAFGNLVGLVDGALVGQYFWFALPLVAGPALVWWLTRRAVRRGGSLLGSAGLASGARAGTA